MLIIKKEHKMAGPGRTLANASRCQGFTLIEIMVVVIVIGIMASLIIPKMTSVVKDSRASVAKSNLKSLQNALERYSLNVGGYPSTEQGLKALVTDPGDASGWASPYLPELPLDPWGNEFYYLRPGSNNMDFDLKSLGADGKLGGEEQDADVSVWREAS